MFNFIEKLKDYKARRDNADMLIRIWKVENNNVYADFTSRIDAIANGNISVLEQMFQLAKDCVPQEALNLYTWLGDLGVSSTDMQLQWAGKYADVIAECLVQKHLWRSVNLKTSEVTLSATKRKDCLTVCADTPMQLWETLPLDIRNYIADGINGFLEDTKFGEDVDKETLVKESHSFRNYCLWLMLHLQGSFWQIYMIR